MVDPLGGSEEEVSVGCCTMISEALFLLQQREGGFLHDRELKKDIGIKSVSRGTQTSKPLLGTKALQYSTVDTSRLHFYYHDCLQYFNFCHPNVGNLPHVGQEPRQQRSRPVDRTSIESANSMSRAAYGAKADSDNVSSER